MHDVKSISVEIAAARKSCDSHWIKRVALIQDSLKYLFDAAGTRRSRPYPEDQAKTNRHYFDGISHVCLTYKTASDHAIETVRVRERTFRFSATSCFFLDCITYQMPIL